MQWADTKKGDEEKLEYRCGLVAKEIKRQAGGSVRSHAPAGGEEDVALIEGDRAWSVS